MRQQLSAGRRDVWRNLGKQKGNCSPRGGAVREVVREAAVATAALGRAWRCAAQPLADRRDIAVQGEER